MAGYLVRNYKSVYRILPVIDNATNDFCRDCNGKIDEDNVYIPCYYNSRIWHYGRSKLIAYIPSVQRGHNVIKALKENGVNVFDCDESDEEVVFKFNASDMNQVSKVFHSFVPDAILRTNLIYSHYFVRHCKTDT